MTTPSDGTPADPHASSDALAEESALGALGLTRGAAVTPEDAAAAASIGLSAEPAALPEGSLDRLLGRARALRQPLPSGGRVVRGASDMWDSHPAPGVRLRVLHRDDARRRLTVLIEVDAGARFPAHRHGGDEECVVLSGDMVSNGQVLHAGDYLFMPAGSRHKELRSVNGCRCVVTMHDYVAA